jgi:hypothetical protein
MKLTPDQLTASSLGIANLTGDARRRPHLTRRGFLAAAGLTGAAASAPALLPVVAHAQNDDDRRRRVVAPRPIPQTLAPGLPFHLVGTGPGGEPSNITDFAGVVGRAQIRGAGTGFGAQGIEELLFEADCGFMQGRYVGVDDRLHHGTFGFV